MKRREATHPPRGKRYQPLRVFCRSSDCPYDETALRSRIERAKPVVDSSGRVIDPGDPDFLAPFIRLGKNRKNSRGSIVVDVVAWEKLMHHRSLGNLADGRKPER